MVRVPITTSLPNRRCFWWSSMSSWFLPLRSITQSRLRHCPGRSQRSGISLRGLLYSLRWCDTAINGFPRVEGRWWFARHPQHTTGIYKKKLSCRSGDAVSRLSSCSCASCFHLLFVLTSFYHFLVIYDGIWIEPSAATTADDIIIIC